MKGNGGPWRRIDLGQILNAGELKDVAVDPVPAEPVFEPFGRVVRVVFHRFPQEPMPKSRKRAVVLERFRVWFGFFFSLQTGRPAPVAQQCPIPVGIRARSA